MRHLQNTKRIAALSSLATLMLAALPAKGVLVLTVSEPGFATLTVTDAGNTGAISYFGPYGDFQSNFIAGTSSKLAGTTPTNLQLTSIDIKSVASAGVAKTLTLSLSDDGFTFPGATGSPVLLSSAVGGTITGPVVGSHVTFQSSETPGGVVTPLQSYTVSAADALLPTTSFSVPTTSAPFTRPATYTLSNSLAITLTGGAETSNISASTTVSSVVPEPMALTLLTPGLLLRRARNA